MSLQLNRVGCGPIAGRSAAVSKSLRPHVIHGIGAVHNRLRHGLLAALVPLACLGCGQGHPQPNLPATPVVRVVTTADETVIDYQYFTGRTDASESVEIRARVTGYLMEIGFTPGDDIKKGHSLFKIDARPYQAELDRAESQVQLSEASLKLAEADVVRVKQISKTPGAISQQDIDKYSATRSQSDASLRAAKATVESAQLNLNFTDVTSPIEGRAGRNLITVGNLVVQDQTMLTTVVSEDPMYAYFDVDERTILRVQKLIREGKAKSVREGAKLPVDIGLANETDKYPHSGTLDFVNNRLDPSTGTLQVRGILENPAPEGKGPRLLTAGLFIRVRFAVGTPYAAIPVPQAAINTDQGKKYLLVVTDKNTVEYRPVDPGPIQPDGRQVVHPVKIVRTAEEIRPAKDGETSEDSIKPGEKVIVSGMQRVRPGATVDPKPFGAANTN